jgi:hypothetical protein
MLYLWAGLAANCHSSHPIDKLPPLMREVHPVGYRNQATRLLIRGRSWPEQVLAYRLKTNNLVIWKGA